MPDQNKNSQSLSPDLKEIYDRVMNTSAKGMSVSEENKPPSTPSSTTTPIQPTTATTTTTSTPNPIPPTPPSTPPSTTTPIAPAQKDEKDNFLTSTPPRPLHTVGVSSFATAGKPSPTATAVKQAEKKGFSKPIIIALGVVFFVAWSFFWYVFFFQPFN